MIIIQYKFIAISNNCKFHIITGSFNMFLNARSLYNQATTKNIYFFIWPNLLQSKRIEPVSSWFTVPAQGIRMSMTSKHSVLMYQLLLKFQSTCNIIFYAYNPQYLWRFKDQK